MTLKDDKRSVDNHDASLVDAARREMRGEGDGRRSDTVTNGGSPTGAGSGGPTPGSSGTRQAVLRANGTPEHIAQYHIKRRIAATHMSVVYEATQEHPRRTVAIKVMKHGISSRRALRRFQYESQILARLQHPCIAYVYEAGWYRSDGERLPYFAMEYLPGAKSLTEHTSAARLSTVERLKLFVEACQAIHHGHQRGIIHRDIKPGNILVGSDGQVKVIDFGVARSTDSDLNRTTQQTSVGEMVGTLRYMSPEQCKADPNDLDIRSDIYSLGVVLYELLAGRMPYDLDSTPLEAPKIICEEPPTRLSTIDRSLRGDLETITETALEKDRRRRYQSALAMADDIKRYLSDEPIQARPASAVYRFKKFVRRRRVPLAAAAVVLVAVLGGMVAQVRAWTVSRQFDRVNLELDFMEAGAALLDFRREIVEAREILETAERALRLKPDDTQAMALRGRAHFLMRNYEAAGRDCRATLARDPENRLALRTCAHVHYVHGEYDAAREMYERGMDAYQVSIPEDLPLDFHNRARLRRLAQDYELAIEDHDRAVALWPGYGMPYKSRGATRYMMGDIEGAIADLERAASLPERGGKERRVKCYLLIWEMRMLRGAPGDRRAAEIAFDKAEKAGQGDPRTAGLFEVLRGQRDADEYLASLVGRQDPSDRAQGRYYLGVQALIEGNQAEAIGYFKRAADPVLRVHQEYDLARWHLSRLVSDSEGA